MLVLAEAGGTDHGRVERDLPGVVAFFFYNDTATTEIYTVSYTLSLHDALPVTPPGGETLAVVAARVRGALARLIAAHAGETAVLVSHAIVVRLIVLAALGLGPERLWAVDASPAGITEIEYLGDWATVHRMNTLAHLDDLPEAGS